MTFFDFRFSQSTAPLRHFLRASATAFCLLLTTACASTIGNVSSLDEVTFEVGKTHKAEIAETLGLPSNRIAEGDVEYWGYPNKPRLTGVFYAFPTGANQVTTYTVTTHGANLISMAGSAVIYTFDSTGTLIDVIKPSTNK